MSSERKIQAPTGKKDLNETLDSILDFGPVPTPSSSSSELSDRIRQIVKKLQEINQRIDNLASRF